MPGEMLNEWKLLKIEVEMLYKSIIVRLGLFRSQFPELLVYSCSSIHQTGVGNPHIVVRNVHSDTNIVSEVKTDSNLLGVAKSFNANELRKHLSLS